MGMGIFPKFTVFFGGEIKENEEKQLEFRFSQCFAMFHFEQRWFLQELQMVMMVAVLKNSLDLTLHTFGHRAQEKCWNLQGSECSKWL